MVGISSTVIANAIAGNDTTNLPSLHPNVTNMTMNYSPTIPALQILQLLEHSTGSPVQASGNEKNKGKRMYARTSG